MNRCARVFTLGGGNLYRVLGRKLCKNAAGV